MTMTRPHRRWCRRRSLARHHALRRLGCTRPGQPPGGRNLWAAELAAGGTIESVGSRLDGDLLGDDPSAAYAGSASAAAAAFRRPGALDAPCAVSYGPVPGSVYAGPRFLDVLVHGWDLAAATGQDYALDPDLMEACQQIIEPQLDAFRSAGALAPQVAAPADANAQTRFLAMLGRTG